MISAGILLWCALFTFGSGFTLGWILGSSRKKVGTGKAGSLQSTGD